MKRRMAQRAPVGPKKMDGKMFCQMHTISILTYKINVTMGQLCSHGLDIHLLQNVILLLLLGNRKHRLTHQANTLARYQTVCHKLSDEGTKPVVKQAKRPKS